MLKSAIVRSSLHATGWALRRTTLPMPRQFIWDRICVPYLSWRNDEVICRTRSGQRFRVCPNDFVENRLCFFGVWEPQVTALFHRVLARGDVVLDVGANIGYYSSLASQIVGSTGQVIAVEASHAIRQRLEFNLHLNHARNVTVLPYAAWHETGTATLHIASDNRGGSSLCEMANRESSESVKLSRLDDLIPESLFSRIRLIKIDVEGAEYHALRGLARVFEATRDCVVVCEIDPTNIERLGASASDIFRLLRAYGYSAFDIANSYAFEDYARPSDGTHCLTALAKPPLARSDVVFATDAAQFGQLQLAKQSS